MSKQMKKGSAGMREESSPELLRYPLDKPTWLILLGYGLDIVSVPFAPTHESGPGYHPAAFAHFALDPWDQYLETGTEHHQNDVGTWPIALPISGVHDGGSRLSASTEGGAPAVLVRAYRFTGQDNFLAAVRRAVRTCERDIMDAGTRAPVGEYSVFLEEVAVYLAAHSLAGFVFTLFGRYANIALTGKAQVEQLIRRCLSRLHGPLEEFEVGFSVCADILTWSRKALTVLELQTEPLEVLASHSKCKRCEVLSKRWNSCQRQWKTRLRFLISSRCASFDRAPWNRVRTALFPKLLPSRRLHACVAVTSFPMTDGKPAVLVKTALVTSDIWDIEYQTRQVRHDAEGLIIHAFAMAAITCRYFPTMWLCVLVGLQKLTKLMRVGTDYHVILPQGGVCTSTFAGPAARCVDCIDRGNLTLLGKRASLPGCNQALAKRHWQFRLAAGPLFARYWPSLYQLAWPALHLVDHFLVPGDEAAKICRKLGVPQGRPPCFVGMVGVHRYAVLDPRARANLREENSILPDAIVVATACRLAPETGLDIAMGSIGQALHGLSTEVCRSVCVIIADDGSERAHELEDTYMPWRETPATGVKSLLRMSDMFLLMAVLEAMASGCTVVASTRPLSNAHTLAAGCGIAVSAENVEETAKPLGRLHDALSTNGGPAKRLYGGMPQCRDVYAALAA